MRRDQREKRRGAGPALAALALALALACALGACGPGAGQTGPAAGEEGDQESRQPGPAGEPEKDSGEKENPEQTAGEEPGEEGNEMEAGKYETLFQEMTRARAYKGINDTNPIMVQSFGADPYAMVYGDRVYFYMTGDQLMYDQEGNITENTYAEIDTIRVVSTDDMVNFTDHGYVRAAGSGGSAKWAHNSWAPAAAWKEIDGKPKFFLYFADAGGGIGVLTADSPVGPFTDPLGHGLITRQTPNCSDVVWLFDPAVLVDEDGRAYLYFGGGVPEGKVAEPGTGRAVELGEDMISIKGEPVTLDVPYLFEDSGIHKFGGKYYYTYCTNWQVDQEGTEKYGIHNAEIACLVSDNPLGPFAFQEVILKNPGQTFGLYGNNHHCVFQFQDQWYITYHTRLLEQEMGIEHGYRCTHIDAFSMGEDGTIGTILQNKAGRKQLKQVDPFGENRAVNVSIMAGCQPVAADAESLAWGSGNMALGEIRTGNYIKINGVDFGSGRPGTVKLTARSVDASSGEGVVQVRLDNLFGPVLGYVPMDQAGESFDEIASGLLTAPEGVHDLIFLFYGEGYEIETWQFCQ